MTRKPMLGNLVGSLDLYHLFTFVDYEGVDLLFLAEDQNHRLYLCVCYEMQDTQEWVLAETTLRDVQAMVDGVIDVHDAMLAHSKGMFCLVVYASDRRLSSRHARLDELGDWVLPEAGEYLTYFSDEKRAAFRALRESIEKHTVPAAYEAFRSFTFLEKWSSKFILSQEKWSFDHFEVNSIVQRLDSTTEAVFNPPSSYVIDKATYSNSPINDVPVGDAVPLAAA